MFNFFYNWINFLEFWYPWSLCFFFFAGWLASILFPVILSSSVRILDFLWLISFDRFVDKSPVGFNTQTPRLYTPESPPRCWCGHTLKYSWQENLEDCFIYCDNLNCCDLKIKREVGLWIHPKLNIPNTPHAESLKKRGLDGDA